MMALEMEMMCNEISIDTLATVCDATITVTVGGRGDDTIQDGDDEVRGSVIIV